MPKNILRCSASLRIDGIAKRLIATEMTVEVNGAIQRYFLFQKKKKITDTMGMIQRGCEKFSVNRLSMIGFDG